MKKYLLTIIYIIGSFSLMFGQKYQDIKFKIKNYDNDTLLIAYFFGEKQLVKDTIFAKKKGEFEFKADSVMDAGVYIGLLYPSKNYFQFVVNDYEMKYTITIDANNLQDATVKGSNDNQQFYTYLNFLSDRNKLASKLNVQKDSLSKLNKSIKEIDDKLDLLDKEVDQYQIKTMADNPKTITTMLIRANRDIKLPEFKGDEKDVNMQKYLYYKKHFFDNIDFKNKATLFTPFIHNKIETFMSNLTPPIPDSINESIDIILEKMDTGSNIFQYYVAWFLNRYAQSQYVGMDGVYVHLVEKYYAKGLCPWVEQDKLVRIIDNALHMKNVLIGKKAPSLTIYKEDNTPINVDTISSKYLMLIFWKPDCGHCKASMPDVIKFQEKYKDKGVKVISICSKLGDKTTECWDKVKELKMENLFLNLWDSKNTSNFHSEWNIQTTPSIFILDKDKKILIKSIPSEKLDEIMDEIIKEDQVNALDKK